VVSNLGQVMSQEIHEIPQVLRRILDANLQKSIKDAISDFTRFRSVIILARGTSDNAAHFLKYLIETSVGIPCGLASPSAATMYEAKFDYKDVLLVSISQSGRSTDLITFAEKARAGGAFLVSITNDEKSPLALLADLHLPLHAGPELAVPATKSYIAQLAISYLFIATWVEQPFHFDRIIAGIEKVLLDQSEYLNFAKKIDTAKPLYILGRGFSYPNAREFALKLQETSLIPVQGMSSSDFLHGPIASLSRESQVIFVSPEHSPIGLFGDAPDRVRAITPSVFWMGRAGLNLTNEPTISGPAGSDEVTASIVDAVIFQKITHQLAVSRGLDPDSPEGLSKVTITH
jgi:glucosamine--fructose-6-phosphate aminotransferase (isomerizing)